MELTDYLAIYGALLSTLVFAWNAIKARPTIKVRLVHSVNNAGGEVDHGVHVSIQNPSSHTVHISRASFVVPSGKASVIDKLKHVWRYRRLPSHVGWVHASMSLYGVDDRCPLSIEPGMSVGIEVPGRALRQLMLRSTEPVLKIQVQDALWRNIYSAKFAWVERPSAAAPAIGASTQGR
ncbi:hypothetical protein [Sphingopyxis fribergensis]